MNVGCSTLDTVKDFLIKIHLAEISISSLNNGTIRLTKNMNRAHKNWARFYEIKYFKNILYKKLVSNEKHFWEDSANFLTLKNALKIKIMRWSRRLLVILVSLLVTLFNEKILICIRGFMSNSIKKIFDGLYSFPTHLICCFPLMQCNRLVYVWLKLEQFRNLLTKILWGTFSM